MAKRFYLSPIIREEVVDTDPVTGETETTVRFTPKAIKLLDGVPGVTTGAVVGVRSGETFDPPWALVIVDAPDHGAVLGDAEIDALPAFPLDGKLTAMQNQTRNRMLATLSRRGLDATTIGNADGFRDVVRLIGQRVRPEFGEHLTTFFS